MHPIAAVQQAWSVTQRCVEAMMPVLAELEIALVAHSALGHGTLMQTQGDLLAQALAKVATDYGVTPSQMAPAWVHNRGRRSGQMVIPLPGTTRVAHLLADIAAAQLTISDADLDHLDAAAAETEGAPDV